VNSEALLDTNIVAAIMNGDPAALARAQSFRAVHLCAPVLGELWYGSLASSRVRENLERLDRFARKRSILNCDSGTSVVYAEMKFQLRKKGKPIPENDYWIAALACQHGVTLLTRDSHFNQIEGLQLDIF
jgi:tRNA(fMet)-specific endonuclease VapC